MAPMPLGILSSVGGVPKHWIAAITPYSTYYQSPIDTYVEESTDSIYVTHHGKSPLNNTSNFGNLSATINKLSFAGQRFFDTTAGINKSSGSYRTRFNRILKGSNGLYVAGATHATSTTTLPVPYIGKINTSSGAADQQFTYSTFSGGGDSRGDSSAIDSGNNIYFANGQFDNAIMKFSSSGTMLLHKAYSEVNAPDGYFTGFVDIKIDSNNNVYLFGNRTNQTTSTSGVIVKLNSSGDIVWSRIMYTTEIYSGEIDSSTGNIYIVGSYGNKHNTNPGNYMLGLVIKINSSGNFQWARKISATANSTFDHCIVDQLNGDIYISGTTSSTSSGIIYKLNSSGSTIWSRRIYGINQSSTYVASMDISSEDFVASIGITFTSNYIAFPMILKLPKSGLLTGSYTVGSNTVVYTSAQESLVSQSDPSSAFSMQVSNYSTNYPSSAPSHLIGTSGTGTQLKIIA